MLGSVASEGTTIVADLEAGIGTLTRLAEAAVDVTVVVVEPTPRSIDVATRAIDVASAQKQGAIVIVANKIANDDDRDRIRHAFPAHQIIEVPVDKAVDDADRLGISPLDHAPDCPAVAALSQLATVIAAASAS